MEKSRKLGNNWIGKNESCIYIYNIYSEMGLFCINFWLLL